MTRTTLTVLFSVAGGFLLAAGTPAFAHAELATYPQEVTASQTTKTQSGSGPVALFVFDGSIDNAVGTSATRIVGGAISYERGLTGQALSLGTDDADESLTLSGEDLPFDTDRNFTVQFWMRTVADTGQKFVVLSQKEFVDNSLASQKQAGWVFYYSGGTWAWSMGSGERRITYERDNGIHMPLNDGRWHQLALTFNSALSVVRLFYDGDNKVTYNVRDSDGFDFHNDNPVVIGRGQAGVSQKSEVLPLIQEGATDLQRLVDVFNELGLDEIEANEFVHLIVDPRRLFDQKVAAKIERLGADSLAFREAMDSVDWEPISEAESDLMANPYTVHQVLNFMAVAPLMDIYALVDGRVTVNGDAAREFADQERLDAPQFDMDNLAIWDRTLSPEEILASYAEHFVPAVVDLKESLTALTAGCWNIWHGGKHLNVTDNGLDSRRVIADILRRENADVVMMQETYSSGDFIAAELGYYFATTVDRDYLNQGSNISVLSRYPIEEIYVQDDSPFMNVAVRVAISNTQLLYVMSNWYGMQQFPAVFEYHQDRFLESDVIPTLFAGDFNAVPHTDDGDSPASVAMLNAGFTDAFRSLYPDVAAYPGYTHRSGNRIDQVYYKGTGLENTSTRVLSTWPAGFPSDHYLILSTFNLDYSTTPASR